MVSKKTQEQISRPKRRKPLTIPPGSCYFCHSEDHVSRKCHLLYCERCFRELDADSYDNCRCKKPLFSTVPKLFDYFEFLIRTKTPSTQRKYLAEYMKANGEIAATRHVLTKWGGWTAGLRRILKSPQFKPMRRLPQIFVDWLNQSTIEPTATQKTKANARLAGSIAKLKRTS